MSLDERNPAQQSSSYIFMSGSADDSGVSPLSKTDCAELEDQELMGLLVEKQRAALEVLYDRYGGAIYSLAMHMLRDQGAAEEVAQDTFFNVWRRASSYAADRGKVSAWLFSIGHNRIIDELRKRRRRDQTILVPDIEAVHQTVDESADPAKYAEQQWQRSRIKEALQVLRPEQRDVVILAYYGGLTHSEIAEKLKQPLGTVKTRMRLALKKLRETMGPQARGWVDGG